jgi:hypothetical protein
LRFRLEDRRNEAQQGDATCEPGGALAAAVGLVPSVGAAMLQLGSSRPFMLAQAMVPPTGMMDSQFPIPMNERYLRRFPQAVRVGDLIGQPVLELDASTLGYVQKLAGTPAREIKFMVSYGRWWAGSAARLRYRWKRGA